MTMIPEPERLEIWAQQPELVISRTALGGSGEIVTLTGELDMASASAVREALNGIDHPGAVLILDISGLSFIDSHGLHAMLGHPHAKRLRVVVPPNGIVRRVLDLVAADSVLNMSDSIEEALLMLGEA